MPKEPASTSTKPSFKTSWKETFANGAILSLETVELAAKFAPVPYLSDAAGSALSIVRSIQDAHDNKGDFQQLAEDSTSIVIAIFNSYNKSDNQKEWPGDHLRDVVIDIVNTLKEISAFVEERKDKNLFLRIVNHDSDAKDIEAYREKLNLAIRKFGVSSHLELHETLRELKKMITDLAKTIEELKKDVQENSKANQDPKKKSVDESTRNKEAELKDEQRRLDKLRKQVGSLEEILQRRERERTGPPIHVVEEDSDDDDERPQRRSRSRRSPRSTPDVALSEGLSNLNISPAPTPYETSNSSSHPPSARSQSHSPQQFNQFGAAPNPQPQQYPFYPYPNAGSPYPQGYYQPPYMSPYASPYGPPGVYGFPHSPSHLSVNSGNTSVTNTINSNNNSSTVINEGTKRSKHRKSPSSNS